jgi:hypothetical protein
MVGGKVVFDGQDGDGGLDGPAAPMQWPVMDLVEETLSL